MNSIKEIIVDYVNKAKKGDREAFVWLYQNNINKIYYVCLKFLKNEEEAKDVAQDTFVTVIEKIDTLNVPEYFGTWINHIAVNKCKNILAKNEKMVFEEIEEFNYEEDIEELNREFIPEEYVASKEKRDIIMNIIDNELSDVQRITILLYYYEGESVEKIARIMECSENTVKSRLKLARNIIKKSIEEKEKKGISIRSVAPIFALSSIFAEDAKACAIPQDIYCGMIEEFSRMTLKRTGNMVKRSLGFKVACGVAGMTAAVGIGVGVMFMTGSSDGEETSKDIHTTTRYEGNTLYEDDENISIEGDEETSIEDVTSDEYTDDKIDEDEIVDYIIANNGKVPDGLEEDAYIPEIHKIIGIIFGGFINLDAEAMKPYLDSTSYDAYERAFNRILKDDEAKTLWLNTLGNIIYYENSGVFLVKDVEYIYMSWYTDCYKNNVTMPNKIEEISKQELLEVYEKYYLDAPYTAIGGYEYDYEIKDGKLEVDIRKMMTKYGYGELMDILAANTIIGSSFNYAQVLFGDGEFIYTDIYSGEENRIDYIDSFLDKEIEKVISYMVESNNSMENPRDRYQWSDFEKYCLDPVSKEIIKNYIVNECDVLYGGYTIAIYHPMSYELRPLSFITEADKADIESRALTIVDDGIVTVHNPEYFYRDAYVFCELIIDMLDLGLLQLK